MALTLIQAGAALQMIDANGVLSNLTLPTGVTLRTDVKPRWAISNQFVVMVNTPSQPLIIDAKGIVRLLSPKAPRLAATLSAVAGGTLTGIYSGVRYTFVTKDTNGNLISESDYSPASGAATLTAQFLKASGLDLSPDTISGRRLYRPTSTGAVLFQWVDLDGNLLTSVQDDLADASLSIFGAPILGTPPHLTTIAEFRGRLFGSGEVNRDQLRYTEAGFQYAWPADNLILMPPNGSDNYGIVGLIPRREALGVGRRNTLLQVTGSGTETSDGGIDFNAVILSKELGIESQESLCVFRDKAYFLWQDGIYTWGTDGIKCVSDGVGGRGQVRKWFTTNSYFNQDKFSIAFAHIDRSRPIYRLFLCSAGSSVIDSFIELDINDNTFWGPHSTALFSPTSAFSRTDRNDNTIAVVGGPAYVYQPQETRTDSNGTLASETGIAFDVISKRHAMEDPDADKYFGQLSFFGKAQTAGSLTITASVGELNAVTTHTETYDMTLNRQRLGRMGTGKHCQLELFNNVAGQDVEIYGYAIDPVNILGRR